MGIMLSKVRISNFRSIESISLDLGMINLLIGQNNTGKTNFLRAINIAIAGATDLSENDIYIAQGERLNKAKKATIDILFRPVDTNGQICELFSDFWIGIFTETWISTSSEGNIVGIRTEIKLDTLKDSYILNRYCIRQWGDSIESATLDPKKPIFYDTMRTALQTSYMDANRDIVQDLRNRKSYFGRVTSGYALSDETIVEIESHLNNINSIIINGIPALSRINEHLSAVVKTIGESSSTVEIEPLARKVSDLNKGMDIVVKDETTATFPIAHHGSGTRSWISFLTLAAYVEAQDKKIHYDDIEAEQYIMLTMEEPEAHLHPQAQRQLYSQISRFSGQKIISTHSPSIVAQSNLTDTIHFSKREGKTSAVRYLGNSRILNQDAKITREVINTRADILFASAVVLIEGITEELALPMFFNEYFEVTPFSLGVSFISISGKNYRSYLSLIKDFDIPWFIFSDGEENTISTIKSAITDIFNLDCSSLDNVVFLDNGCNYEKYLIHEGYTELIIEAICEHEGVDNFFGSYISQMNGQKRKGGGLRNYEGQNGRQIALYDLCQERKTQYILPIVAKIISYSDKDKRIPPKIKQLFIAISKRLGIIDISTKGKSV